MSANLINKYERKRGSLEVTKSWDGDDIGETAKAGLSITITGPDIGGENVNTLTIGYADLPFTKNNLPVGESYTVEETNAAGLNANYTLITTESVQKVEDLVNEAIARKLPIVCTETTVEEAKKAGAMHVFENKYGDVVKIS